MSDADAIGLDEDLFRQIAHEYRQLTGLDLCAVKADGTLVHGAGPSGLLWREARARALAEALRWGEPTIQSCPDAWLLWAAPLMRNSRLLGGLAAAMPEVDLFGEEGDAVRYDIRRACTLLRHLVEKYDLVNADLLERRRSAYRREQLRAETIHSLKVGGGRDLRTSYFREEPVLLAAVRKGDLAEARERINVLLTAVFQEVGGEVDRAKSYSMELAVMMCRTAIEAGGNERELLSANYAAIEELFRLTDMEALAPWLHRTLDHILESMRHSTRRNAPMMLSGALEYISTHLTEDISRDEVARAAGMSPTHFSRTFRKHVGRSFVDYVNQMRSNRAAEFLVRSDKPLALVALEAGFRSQSYFSKVFKAYMGMTPGQYRDKRVPAANEAFG